MTIDELYAKLCSPEFKDAAHGDMFYNFFIFQYDPKKEYEMRHQIAEFKANLKRPVNFVDVLTLDLFKELCAYLDSLSFDFENPSLKHFYIDIEKRMPDKVQKLIEEKANNTKFLQFIHNRIMAHVNQHDEYKRPYIFVYGLGDVYPYIRAHRFLTDYEKYNKTNKYRLLLFYPGECIGNNYSLFGDLDDSKAVNYRARLLNPIKTPKIITR